MLNPLVFALTTLVQGQPAPNARQVLTTAASKQVQRLSAVDNYTIIQTVNGSAVPLHFGRAAAQDRGADDPGSGTGRADDAQGALEMEVTRTVHAWNKGPPASWSTQTPP